MVSVGALHFATASGLMPSCSRNSQASRNAALNSLLHRVMATVPRRTTQPRKGCELAKHSWLQGCVGCGGMAVD